ncbi:aldo/keto reductase [Psychrobium sp. nBUS_13]|uniref:aldo/keto reductase n=1 Tax=Psychrobium sp. nBUS_13 TaxID=3395319 RepID=UPI003EBDCD31
MSLIGKLGLGTVQFGVDYGVSNKNGKVAGASVNEILKRAQSCGITTLDTSPAYGTAEDSLGKSQNINNSFDIVTKTLRVEGDSISDQDILNIESIFFKSLKKMNASSIYGLLAHNGLDLCKVGYQKYFDLFERLKSDGLVKKTGASVYNKLELESILKCGHLDIIQIPLNIFDQEMICNGYLDELKAGGVEIHVRSTFLQGLLLMPPSSINPYFAPIKNKLARYHKLLKEHQLTALEACLAFSLSHDCVDKVIIGITNDLELEEIVSAAATAATISLPDFSNYSMSDSQFSNPSKWKLI